MCYSETHPLAPFLPYNAKILILGSFPPPKKRWCMEFFYPNWNNDFWRIMGYVAKADRNYFIVGKEKRFDKEKIEKFCTDCGIALYDTAEKVIRLKNNASDNFLQIISPTDIASLLERIPLCTTIVATGQKAAEAIQAATGCRRLSTGENTETEYCRRKITIWRMPSTSRAYPLPFEQKAGYYRKILEI